MTQAQAVIETIDKLGGIATLNQINQHIFEIEECVWKTKTPFASIRRIVQLTKGIYKIKPGLYALESHRNQLENDGIMVHMHNRVRCALVPAYQRGVEHLEVANCDRKTI